MSVFDQIIGLLSVLALLNVAQLISLWVKK